MRLLDPLNARRASLETLWSILPDARLVGGSVRDLLLGAATVHDIDLATPETPQQVQNLLGGAGIRTLPTGLSHGTITAVLNAESFEITTLRRDATTDGRHAQVQWTHDWREDAARRDFTINALYCDRQGKIHDYFGGRDDLKAKRVRFVGKAEMRIKEDALRMLRFFRFDARFGSETPDAEAVAGISANLDLLAVLSKERVFSEIQRILTGPHVMRTLRHMRDCGVLTRLIPMAKLDRLARALHLGLPADAILRLGVLTQDPAQGRNFKLSTKQAQRLSCVQEPQVVLSSTVSDDDLRCLLADHTKERLMDATWCYQAQDGLAFWTGLRERLTSMETPTFPLFGRDVVAAGLSPGPEVGEALQAVSLWWRQHACAPDRAACLSELTRRLSLSPFNRRQ